MLTQAAIKAAKPTEKPFKLSGDRGMYLLVKNAGRYWMLDYRIDGKRKTLSIGVYPEVSLRSTIRSIVLRAIRCAVTRSGLASDGRWQTGHFRSANLIA
jgi:hypothetical protein